MKRQHYRYNRGSDAIKAFTMIEVLVAGTILAMATFMVVGLLKLSDEMSFRAKVDAKVSQIMKTRANSLVSMSFESLEGIAQGAQTVGGIGRYEFVNGQFNNTYVGNSSFYFSGNPNGFPFLEAIDPFTIGQPNAFKFLLSAKPLPGNTGSRNIFPFVEKVVLQFVDNSNDPQPLGSSTIRRANIQYSVWWVNEFIRSTEVVDPLNDQYQKLSSVEFEFAKYDPSTY